MFEHCSPLELFRRLLVQFGMDSKQFQTLANTVPQHWELCAMALCVLCSDQPGDQPIKVSLENKTTICTLRELNIIC